MLALRQEIDGCGTLSGLAAMARKSEQDILGMMKTSAKNTQAILELRQELAGCVAVKTTVDDIKTTHDMLALRQEIDGCGTLSGLAAMARKSEQDILGMMETSAKNTQAILELRQELAGCVAVKTTVDDIKTRQLTRIRENITKLKTILPPSIPPSMINIPRPSTPSTFGWTTTT
jgi:hypothetical protein